MPVTTRCMAFLVAATALAGPLRFEENDGQLAAPALFQCRGNHADLIVSAADATFLLRAGDRRARVRVALEGAVAGRARGEHRLPFESNYFLGADPRSFHAHVPSFGRVRIEGQLPGVDVAYDGGTGRVEQDIVLRPGARADALVLSFDGADCLEVDGAGDLVLGTTAGDVRWLRPHACQDGGGTVELASRYERLDAQHARIVVLDADPSRALVVDPVLVYSTYLGGSDDDEALSVATDVAGNTYLAGTTYSPDFPLSSPLQATPATAFVTKIDPSGQSLSYSTYLGGSDTDAVTGMAVEGSGAVVLVGSTESIDFPMVAPLQGTYGGGRSDAFVARLDPSGAVLTFSTYLGGANDDAAAAVAIDPSGNIAVCGETGSADFPTKDAIQPDKAGYIDAFVSEVSPLGQSFVFSTFLGGFKEDRATGVGVDGSGAVAVCGFTDSDNFPVKQPIQPARAGGRDGFVLKLAPLGLALSYATYLGGKDDDWANALAVDPAGEVVVAGYTKSDDFPTASPLQATCGEGSPYCKDAFVTKLLADGSGYAFSTFLGGDGHDEAHAVALGGGGTISVAGDTSSNDFPLRSPLQLGDWSQDAFVSTIDAAGSALLFSTYMGGSDRDSATAIAVDRSSVLHVAGMTDSTDFPTYLPLQGANATTSWGSDAFVLSIDAAAANPVSADFSGAPRIGPAPLTVQFTDLSTGPVTSYQWAFGDSATSTAASPSHTYAYDARYTVSLFVSSGNAGDLETKESYVLVSTEPPTDILAAPGPDPAAAPRVRGFDVLGTPSATDFYAYGTLGFGANVAVARLDAAPPADLLTGPGPGAVFGPEVRGFQASGARFSKLDFYAYGTLRYGVIVDGAELSDDAIEEIATGPGPGVVFGPHLRAWSFDGASVSPLAGASLFAYGTLRYGLDIGQGDIDGNLRDELLTAPGPGPSFAPQIRAFRYQGGLSAISGVNFNAFATTGGARVAGCDDWYGVSLNILASPGPSPGNPAAVRGFFYDGSGVTSVASVDLIAFAGAGYGSEPHAGDLDGNGYDNLLVGRGPDPAAPAELREFDNWYGQPPYPALTFTAFSGTYGVHAATGDLGF